MTAAFHSESDLPERARDEQRALGLTEFMSNLSEEGKKYYATTVSGDR